MRRVEQHVIKRSHAKFGEIDALAFASKNLWNLANYYARQSFIFQGKYLNNAALYPLLKHTDAYKALPAKVANQVLIQLDKAWQSFFEANDEYKADPSQFTGRPKLPKYKHKTEGRNLLVYTIQALSKKGLKQGLIQPSMLAIEVQTRHKYYFVSFSEDGTFGSVRSAGARGRDPGTARAAPADAREAASYG